MNLRSLLSDLAYGELSNLAMATDLPGSIRDVDQPKVCRFINDGLHRLYSLFNLKERNVVIEQVDHITYYHLLTKFAESNMDSKEEIKYIKDRQHEPFGDDVIRILEVRNEHGQLMPLNDMNHPRSLFTPQVNLTLQVPHPIEGMPLVITYQAKHSDVTLDKMENAILLPEVLHVPLRCHVAYQVYTSMNTQEATAKAMEYLTRFDTLCSDVQERDTVTSSIVSRNTTFEQRGFI